MSIGGLLSAVAIGLLLLGRLGYQPFGENQILVVMVLLIVSLFFFYKWVEVAIRKSK